MADYRQYFQVVLRPASEHAVEDFFSPGGRYSNFRKETCFLRYLSRAQYGAVLDRLRLWQEDPHAARSGYVYVPALERQMDQSQLERYVALYHGGDYTLPFHFENSILEEAFQENFRQIVQLFRQSRGRTEESILRNFIVRMFFWIDRYFPRLFVETTKIACFPKFACAGTVKLPEYLFLDLLYQMGCDVLYLGQTQDVLVEDPQLLALSTLVTGAEEAPLPPVRASAAPVRARAPAQKPQESPRPPERTAPPPSGEGGPLNYVELAKLASSVVMLQVFDDQGQCLKTGSGVIIQESGYILTNFHVAAGGSYYGVLLEEDPEVCYTNELIKYNQDFDLAILRMGKHRAPIPVWQGTEPLVRGQKVVAIGSPLGLFNTVSDGIISGFRTVGERSMIQFTAPTSHGSSGGALLDLYGNLIGIITAGFDDGQNLNLAVDYQAILEFSRGIL